MLDSSDYHIDFNNTSVFFKNTETYKNYYGYTQYQFTKNNRYSNTRVIENNRTLYLHKISELFIEIIKNKYKNKNIKNKK
jgi:hypothetical protein